MVTHIPLRTSGIRDAGDGSMSATGRLTAAVSGGRRGSITISRGTSLPPDPHASSSGAPRCMAGELACGGSALELREHTSWRGVPGAAGASPGMLPVLPAQKRKALARRSNATSMHAAKS